MVMSHMIALSFISMWSDRIYAIISIGDRYIQPVIDKVRGQNINKLFSSNPMHKGQIPMGRIYVCDWQRVETPVVDREVTILLVRIVLGMGCTYHNKLSRRKRIYTTQLLCLVYSC